MEKNALLKLEKLDMPVVLIKVSLVLPVTHLVRAQDQENPPRGEGVPATCKRFSSTTADPEGVTQRKTSCSQTGFARKSLSGHLPELSKCGTGWAWRWPLWACISAPPGHQPLRPARGPWLCPSAWSCSPSRPPSLSLFRGGKRISSPEGFPQPHPFLPVLLVVQWLSPSLGEGPAGTSRGPQWGSASRVLRSGFNARKKARGLQPTSLP